MARRTHNSKYHTAGQDFIETQLVETFYKLKTNKPALGSGVKFSLKGVFGDKDEALVSPTLDAFCWHFGFYDKIMFRFQHALSTNRPLEDWEQKALRAFQRTRLETLYVKKIREEYKKTFWFYCVPPPEYIAKDSVTGELFKSTAEEESSDEVYNVFGFSQKKFYSSPLVLSVLPTNAAEARERYGLKSNELEELALQAVWLVTIFVARRKIISLQEALQAISSWHLYLPSETYAAISNQIKGYLPV